ncbi:unnamed protein product [Thlaspi arvense]|uniref:Dethiobiotin synthase n=1 Tax=Thlaspi arvense TaxID=13288 RepID=A0AAU9RI45_THLAR|nr:unnamed protein product [Thlaspi arvense]
MFRIYALPVLTCRRSFSERTHCRLYRLLSTHPTPIEHTLSHPIYVIWGANTGVGKTLVSTGLAASFLSSSSLSSSKFIYIKPVQTGFPADSDSGFVYSKLSEIFVHRKLQLPIFASNHVIKASVPASEAVFRGEIGKLEGGFCDLGRYEETKLHRDGGESLVCSELVCKTFYGWREAVSPHLAAQREGAVVEDSELLGMLKSGLRIGLNGGSEVGHNTGVLSVVETAGGVASPGPSGSLQCDLYRWVIN